MSRPPRPGDPSPGPGLILPSETGFRPRQKHADLRKPVLCGRPASKMTPPKFPRPEPNLPLHSGFCKPDTDIRILSLTGKPPEANLSSCVLVAQMDRATAS